MLLDEIETTFSGSAYPGDNALAESYPNEWESTLRQLQGKDWRTVTARDFDSQGGIIEGVQALSIQGFTYFLPGLVRIALTQADHRYIISSALLSRFTRPDQLERPLESQERILFALSPQQREFLARFFAAMQEAEPLLFPVLVKSAISNLASARVDPYRHEDVHKWAAKLS